MTELINFTQLHLEESQKNSNLALRARGLMMKYLEKDDIKRTNKADRLSIFFERRAGYWITNTFADPNVEIKAEFISKTKRISVPLERHKALIEHTNNEVSELHDILLSLPEIFEKAQVKLPENISNKIHEIEFNSDYIPF
ncbi:MAG: hypothetical protein ACPGUD_13075 [Parashewanella sp.]